MVIVNTVTWLVGLCGGTIYVMDSPPTTSTTGSQQKRGGAAVEHGLMAVESCACVCGGDEAN
jgi:hypothetical protein